MKLFLALILSLNTSLALAKAKNYMLCLGQEEARIHKKRIGGAYYKINQEIISALIQLSSSVSINEKYLDVICSSHFSSVEILRLLITKKDLLHTDQSKSNQSQYSIDKELIEELQHQSYFMFVDFLNALQAQAKDSKCIVTYIPELKEFYEKLRFTLEDVGVANIISSLSDIDIIFMKLQKLPTDKKKCI